MVKFVSAACIGLLVPFRRDWSVSQLQSSTMLLGHRLVMRFFTLLHMMLASLVIRLAVTGADYIDCQEHQLHKVGRNIFYGDEDRGT